MEVFLADYGLSTKEGASIEATVRCGTPGYASPEIILG